MIDQSTFKREKRRLGIALGRFQRAALAMRQQPANPYSSEADTPAYEAALAAAITAGEKLQQVAAEGLEIFASSGYPDAWHRWINARDDAAYHLRRWKEETCN